MQDVAKVGRRFEIADVPTGYALNKLIPKGLAEAATSENIKRIKSRAKRFAASKAGLETSFNEALATLEGKNVSIAVQTNEKGHLFEALKTTAIAEALKENNATVSEHQIVIMTPIKQTGDHTVVLTEGDVTSKIVLTVVSA